MARLVAALTYNPETRLYGFSVWIEGRRPHYEMDTFSSREIAQSWVDPHHERIWEETDGSDPGLLAISYGYREGSVPMRLAPDEG